ncbi:hypothetical protein Rs2_18433 [Raphanus sativus]|nr:hypothetical protein Rs2_18433 [Raphanus sativus]
MCNNRGGEETSNLRPIISGESLNIESYSMLYKGRAKIMCLLFIASYYGGNQMLQLELLRMAHDEIQKGENTHLFRDLVDIKAEAEKSDGSGTAATKRKAARVRVAEQYIQAFGNIAKEGTTMLQIQLA